MKIIAIILIIVAIIYFFAAALVYAGVVSAGSLSFLSLGGLLTLASWSSFALVGLALAAFAFIISPDAAGEVVERVASGVSSIIKGGGTIAGGIIGGAVGAVGAAISGSGILGIVVAGAGGYLLWKYLSKKIDTPQPQTGTTPAQIGVS